MLSNAFSCNDMEVSDIEKSFAAFIGEGNDGEGGKYEAAKNPSSNSNGSLKNDLSNMVDSAISGMTGFISFSSWTSVPAGATRSMYKGQPSYLCITYYKETLYLRLHGSSRREEIGADGSDGKAALARVKSLGYCKRAREVERLVCNIGRRDEEKIVFVFCKA